MSIVRNSRHFRDGFQGRPDHAIAAEIVRLEGDIDRPVISR
jgi:hypothetical protein